MKPFRFRLETLLDFRKMQKEQSQITFLKATNQLRIEKEKLMGLESKLAENIQLLRVSQQQSLTVEKLKFFKYYFDRMNKDILQQQQSIVQAKEYCDECLQKLAEAEKNHKIVEKFREKKLQHYQIEAIQEDQKLLDEIGLQIYTREK